MFRHVRPNGVSGYVKDVGKKFARRTLGLELRRAASRDFDVETLDYSRKWLSRFMHFEDLLRQVAHLDGAIVECGVGPGRSLFDFSIISDALNRPRRIIGYDTFEGLPDPTSADGEWNRRAAGRWEYSRERVRRQLLHYGLNEDYIAENITLVAGEFGSTLPHYREGPIALLHIDADIYESYRTALERLYQHVVPGGVIAFDEYRLSPWPGATRAIDEFFEDKPERIIRSPVAERYYVLKCE